jgi:hypothetical protein
MNSSLEEALVILALRKSAADFISAITQTMTCLETRSYDPWALLHPSCLFPPHEQPETGGRAVGIPGPGVDSCLSSRLILGPFGLLPIIFNATRSGWSIPSNS